MGKGVMGKRDGVRPYGGPTAAHGWWQKAVRLDWTRMECGAREWLGGCWLVCVWFICGSCVPGRGGAEGNNNPK